MSVSSAAIIIHEYLSALTRPAGRPFVLGICGAQGSGKSTTSEDLLQRLEESGLGVALISLDDFYLPLSARAELAAQVHKLLQVRGVPGTHDISLVVSILNGLGHPEAVALPRFDKAQESPYPVAQWPIVKTPVDVIIFEGWCVGAMPQDPADIETPVNMLESQQDPDSVWRKFVNDQLAGPYQAVFSTLDCLILLAAPYFSVVTQWRLEQEHALRAALTAAGRPLSQTMSDEEVENFVAHYERLTRHILREMPQRADLVIFLDEARAVLKVDARKARAISGSLESPDSSAVRL